MMTYLFFSAFLFSAGLFLVFTKRNAIVVLMGIELMLNASNLNLVAFGNHYHQLEGQVFALFIIIIAVCEAAVGMAIIVRSYHFFQTSVPDEINNLKEKF